MKKSKTNSGQTLVEYGLIISIMAVVLIGSLLVAKSGMSNTFSKLTSEMENASAS